ncbi:MAG: hypothetical protein RLY85_780 [Bacteroidota bacterium]
MKKYCVIALLTLAACAGKKDGMEKGSFGYDLAFLKTYHKDVVVLGDDAQGPRIVVLPAYQGRVMTSTAEGDAGSSFGWINHELIASGKFTDHFSAFGGEERFWLGPEGGQFSIYFKKGAAFHFDNWQVPKEIDTEPFALVSSDNRSATFERRMQLENYSGTPFQLKVDRTIRLLDDSTINAHLHLLPAGVKAVAFESENVLTNEGKTAWEKTSGMLSIWILSMMNASDSTTIFLPYKQGDSAQLGKIVTDDYFGKVPADRLLVGDGLIRFKADGHYRSKIGLSPRRALPIAASYDAANGVLTLAQFTLGGSTEYVNSLWEIQKDPFSGDAVNAYNDGPIDGKQMGNFYEIESSSPAAALAPGQSLTHVHRTFHLKGNPEQLNQVVLKLFGVRLDKVILE